MNYTAVVALAIAVSFVLIIPADPDATSGSDSVQAPPLVSVSSSDYHPSSEDRTQSQSSQGIVAIDTSSRQGHANETRYLHLQEIGHSANSENEINTLEVINDTIAPTITSESSESLGVAGITGSSLIRGSLQSEEVEPEAEQSAPEPPAPEGSTSTVFTETFEGIFPGDNWYVGDNNANCGSDYWDDTSYRAHAGRWSGWCAQIGDNSVYGGTNDAQHCYDNHMDSYMVKKYLVDMSSWDAGYIDFWGLNKNTENNADYMIALWYTGSTWDSSYQKITGPGSTDWLNYRWQIPYNRLISNGAFGFKFISDISVVYEGVYLDDINLIRADMTVGSSSYISPASVSPGGSITMYYYIHNPCSFTISCGLGASIYSSATGSISDSAHDVTVTLPTGYSWQSRTFTIPSWASITTYDVTFGIWSGTPGDTTNGNRMWGSYTMSGGLTVANPPDLHWSDIWTDPAAPTGGQSATITHRLHNQGGATSTTFANSFYVDSANPEYGSNSGLGAGSSFDWTSTRTLGPGYHTIEARADSNYQVAESNENNNIYSESLWWKGPDLVVDDIWFVDSYGSIISSVTSGQNFETHVRIRNSGDATAVAGFTLYCYMGYWTGWASWSNLGAGATVEFYWTDMWISDLSVHTLTAIVDYYSTVAEANKAAGWGIGTAEGNNQLTDTISIANAQWTVLAYLDGDNDLESYVVGDCAALADLGSTPSLSIAAQLDRIPGYDTGYGNWTDCRRYVVTSGNYPWPDNSFENLGEVDMSSQAVLESFLLWGAERFKADHYLVILDDHGASFGGCCFDDSSSDLSLSLSELRISLDSMKGTIGRNIDVVMFDMCNMGSIELAAQIWPCVDYAVLSETVSWTSSLPFAGSGGVITYLRDNPTTGPATYAIEAVNRGNPHDDPTSVTQSMAAYDLSKMSAFISSVNTLALDLKNGYIDYRSFIDIARANSNQMEGPYAHEYKLIDLYQFAEKVEWYVPNPTIQAHAQDIMDKLGPADGQVGYLVMKEIHNPSASFCRGVCIFFPQAWTELDRDNYLTSGTFIVDTQWDEFLLVYHDSTPPFTESTIIGTPGFNGWFTSDVSIVLTAFDNEDGGGVKFTKYRVDGGSWITYTQPIAFSDDGTHLVEFYSVDYSGNSEDPYIIEVKIDTTEPSTAIEKIGTAGAHEWYTSDVQVTLLPSDDGSGVESTSYRIDIGSWLIGTGPFAVSGNGVHTLEWKSMDRAGNLESMKSVEIWIIRSHLVCGHTYDSYGGIVPNCDLNLSDLQTGEWVILRSNDTGYFEYDLTNLPSGYSTGDTIRLIAQWGSYTGSSETDVTVADVQWLNVNLPFEIPEFATMMLPILGALVIVTGLTTAARRRTRHGRD